MTKWKFHKNNLVKTTHLSVSWEAVPELLVPRAESLPPTCSTIGDRQLNFRPPTPLMLRPATTPPSATPPPSVSQMICLRYSRHRPSLTSLAVSTSRKIWRTLSRDRSGRASSYSCRVVGSRDTGCKRHYWESQWWWCGWWQNVCVQIFE